jgi:hypothetical protein
VGVIIPPLYLIIGATMIEIIVSPNELQVSIPKEMKLQAPILLKDIWRSEFDYKLNFILEMTKSVKEFVERAKLSQQILVYL